MLADCCLLFFPFPLSLLSPPLPLSHSFPLPYPTLSISPIPRMKPDLLPGQSFPLGATVDPEGVNFCIFSEHAEAIELLLFDEANAPQPSRVIKLDPKENKTFYYWHVFVPGIGAGQIYGYRVYGSFAPKQGHRFDASKVLLDPYARAIVGDEIYSRDAAVHPGDNCSQALRGGWL